MERDLSKVTPATLVKSLSVIGKFLELFQEFSKYNLQYKKHHWGVVSLACSALICNNCPTQ